MSKIKAIKITPTSAKRAARAALDTVLLNIATSVAGSKANCEKLMRSIKRGAKRGCEMQAAFFAVAAPVWEAREHLLTA